ncbi:MAG: hypothetical protein AAFY28_22835, partial [Actinomycetota bacterium]
MKRPSFTFLIASLAIAAFLAPLPVAFAGDSPPESNQPNKDLDEDGLINQLEAKRGTKPDVVDSDDDGVDDADDAIGYDGNFTFPALPESHYAIIDLGSTESIGAILALNNNGTVVTRLGTDAPDKLQKLGAAAEDLPGDFVSLNNNDELIYEVSTESEVYSSSLLFSETKSPGKSSAAAPSFW